MTKGDRVTFRINGIVTQGYVEGVHDGYIVTRGELLGLSIQRTWELADEGRLWARGWDTPEALALKAVFAL